MIGKSQKILHAPEDIIGEVSKTFEQHRTDKKDQIIETQVITKKGEFKDVEIKAGLVEMDGKKFLLGIFRDITERKRAEEALGESEERYKALFERSLESVYLCDFEGNFIDANEVDSEVEKGSTFNVYLPITKKRTDAKPYHAEALPSGDERILVIDDELSQPDVPELVCVLIPVTYFFVNHT